MKPVATELEQQDWISDWILHADRQNGVRNTGRVDRLATGLHCVRAQGEAFRSCPVCSGIFQYIEREQD